MSILGNANFHFSSIPPEVWIWAGITLLMTAAMGFAAGAFYGRMSAQHAAHRARKHLSRLFRVVIEALESAQEAALLLEQFPQLVLNPEQTSKLDQKRTRLLDTVSRIVECQQRINEAEGQSNQEGNLTPEEIELIWQRTPQDPETELPNRATFEPNFAKLLQLGRQTGLDGGILLAKIDKFEQLKTRFGDEGVNCFLRKAAGLICRSIREEDFVCRFDVDAFAVLMPGLNGAQGIRESETIRNTIRHHRFHLNKGGPEVLVTASFGFSSCLPEDNLDLIVDRAGEALTKSTKRGRNQLHAYDGRKVVHCRVG